MSAVNLADYQPRFAGASSSVQDALQGCFAEAIQVMGPKGLKSYLEGAYALYSLGKGDDLLASYLEEIPLVVREIGEGIITEIIASLLKMASQTSAPVLALMLSSLPQVAQRMADHDLFIGYLRLVERTMALAPRGLRPLFKNIPQLAGKLTLGGLRRWVMYGAETYRRDFKAQVAYFALESADAIKMLEHERRGTLFVDNHRKLQFYLRAFYNREFFMRPTAGDYETKEGAKPYIAQGVMHIPDAYDNYQSISGIDCYRAVCAHAAAHIIHTRSVFDRSALNQLQVACVALMEICAWI